ncbi:TIGR03571 family LLM class oxidoreductase [Rhizobium leguminosarum]|uniref:TIGR03571 family LLM class oxidoreductase n=1 Tax=Rhizobium leguminosarum TaxID=384 RepID=UPI000483D428|nr:TIGR03571 family LLM class oxidoreductase [Rhizobium leguminosarum]
MFEENRLSIGLALPAQKRERADIDFAVQLDLVRAAEANGFSAVWVRDVPLNNPDYPDPVGHSDPFVLLAAIAATTKSIMLVTGAIVLTLRHPLHVAKAALSLQALSGGRLILGLGSGDRPTEFAVFGQSFEERKASFRTNWDILASALEHEALVPETLGGANGDFSIRPRSSSRVPMLAVGSASQSLEWISRNAVGWATYHRDYALQKDRIGLWHTAIAKTGAGFKSFSQSLNLELVDDPQSPTESINLGYRCGRIELVRHLLDLKELGVHHVMINLTEGSRPETEVIEEIGTSVLPELN